MSMIIIHVRNIEKKKIPTSLYYDMNSYLLNITMKNPFTFALIDCLDKGFTFTLKNFVKVVVQEKRNFKWKLLPILYLSNVREMITDAVTEDVCQFPFGVIVNW